MISEMSEESFDVGEKESLEAMPVYESPELVKKEQVLPLA